MLGRPVVSELIQQEFDVRIGSRFDAKPQQVFGYAVNSIKIDYRDINELVNALSSIDVIHLNLQSGPTFEDCYKNETDVVEQVCKAALSTDIKCISYLSGTNVSQNEQFPPSRAKWLAEEIIRSTGIPYVIWRASWFMETLHRFHRFGMVTIPGNGTTGAHWIAGKDLGNYVAKALRDNVINKELYLFGPEFISMGDAVNLFRDTVHKRSPIISVPTAAILFAGKLFGNKEMWFGAQMLKFLEIKGEVGDPTETHKLLGKPLVNLKEYLTLQ